MNGDELGELRAVAARHPSIKIFVFGSTVYGKRPAHDLDLFLIYTSSEALDAVLRDLDSLPFAPLLDLTMMTPVESEQSGFIGRSRAVSLDDVRPTTERTAPL